MRDDRPPDTGEMGIYLALATVGFEMVVPVVAGVLIDHYAGWGPWATVIGVILGFVGGLSHLVMLANKQDRDARAKEKRKGDKP